MPQASINEQATNITARINVMEPVPNVDINYGPYNSTSEAYQTLYSNGALCVGLTVGISTENGIEEHWFKNGITENDLIPKITQEQNVIPILYYDLTVLVDSAQLLPGALYRIIDYKASAIESKVETENHQFDIIVRAEDESHLSENAMAAHHEGDTYFANSKLEAWELKYALKGEDKYLWVGDNHRGMKGVIYYMKDEWGNECPYDFKNIKFRIPTSSVKYFYTFSEVYGDDESTINDASLTNTNGLCFGNVIKSAINESVSKYDLNGNVFISTYTPSTRYMCCNNILQNDCRSNYFFGNTQNITLLSNCCYNKFNVPSQNGLLHSKCYENTFDNARHFDSFVLNPGVTHSTISSISNTEVQNIIVLSGVIDKTIMFSEGVYQKIAGITSTSGELKIWNPADLATLPSNITYHEDVPNYLTFTANANNSSVGFFCDIAGMGKNMEYSTDNGETWNEYTIGVGQGNTIPIAIDEGESVMFRGNNENLAYFDEEQNVWALTKCNIVGSVSASGDITSLLNGFGGDVAVGENCYCGFFNNCTGLISAPTLPSTTLANGCYQLMFSGCTSLVDAPELPATTLSNSCYYSMFFGCTSLVNVPELPATTLAENCYNGMFFTCNKVTSYDFATLNSSSNVFYENLSCVSLTIHAETPPAISSGTLIGLKSDCIIYVPTVSVDAYKSALNWSERAEYIQAIA